jgi:hypothetical protein
MLNVEVRAVTVCDRFDKLVSLNRSGQLRPELLMRLTMTTWSRMAAEAAKAPHQTAAGL